MIAAEEFTFVIEDDPPLTYIDEYNKPAGFLTEIGKAILKKSGFNIKGNILVLPTIRADEFVRDNPYALIPYMTRKASREDLYHWVGPVALREKWFYKLQSRTDIVVNDIVDLKKYYIGSVRGWSSTKSLVEQGYAVELSENDNNHWKMFLHNRFDIIQARDDEIAYWTKKLKFNTKTEKLILFDDRYMYYMSVNKKTPIELVNKMQKSLDTMKLNGEFEKIRRY